jgi:uncharacterized protein
MISIHYIHELFRPPIGASHPHLQTDGPELPDGDFIYLAWSENPK